GPSLGAPRADRDRAPRSGYAHHPPARAVTPTPPRPAIPAVHIRPWQGSMFPTRSDHVFIHHAETGVTAHGRLRRDTSEAITAILVNTEATAHGYGWNQEPVLFALFNHIRADGTRAVEVDISITGSDLWNTPDPRRYGERLPVPVVLHRFA